LVPIRALRAGAKRGVEREGARLDLGELKRMTVRAGELLGEIAPRGITLLVDEVDRDETIRQAKRGLERSVSLVRMSSRRRDGRQ